MTARKTIGAGHDDLPSIGRTAFSIFVAVAVVVCISIQVSKASAHWQNRNEIFKWTVIYAFNQFLVHFRGMQRSFVCVSVFFVDQKPTKFMMLKCSWIENNEIKCTLYVYSVRQLDGCNLKIASLVKVQNHFCIAIFTSDENHFENVHRSKESSYKTRNRIIKWLSRCTVWFI